MIILPSLNFQKNLAKQDMRKVTNFYVRFAGRVCGNKVVSGQAKKRQTLCQ